MVCRLPGYRPRGIVPLAVVPANVVLVTGNPYVVCAIIEGIVLSRRIARPRYIRALLIYLILLVYITVSGSAY